MDATLDLALLSTFVEVADAASFSGAAKRLGTTTATVSRNIARLEELVGAELIHRTTRHVSLSTAGESLFQRASAHVRALRGAVANLPESQEDPAGTLRITAPYALGATLLGDVVTRFLARYPDIRVEADFSNRNVDLVAEGFDLAIRGDAGVRKDSSLTIKKLASATVGFYAAPSYIARSGTPRVVGAPEHQWILFGPLPKTLRLTQPIEGRVVANDVLFIREATRAGAGIGFIPLYMGERLAASGELVRVLPSFKSSMGGLVLLYPSTGPVARKVAAFRDILIASIKSHGME